MNLEKYDYIVVGAGFFGSVIAERIASQLNKKVAVIERRNHVGGNCYSEVHQETGIEYHKYGTHIFHTSNEKVWEYITQFTKFNVYYHQVLTEFKGKVYQMLQCLHENNLQRRCHHRTFNWNRPLRPELRTTAVSNGTN